MTAKYPYVFIVTYGRSGSTLLQGVLNTIPDYCIRGENEAALFPLMATFDRLARAQKKFSHIGRTPADPWYGIDQFSETGFLEGLRELFVAQVLKPPHGSRCVGYKEIRYAPNMVRDLSLYLGFVRRVFPGAAFVFNTRNMTDVLQSGWWKDRPDAEVYLTEFEASMQAAHEAHAPYSFWVKYDDYASSPEGLKPLFEFLDEPFDLAAVEKTLAVKHSG